MKTADTRKIEYTKRLNRLQYKKWKKVLRVQKLYQWNIQRMKLGKTLDIGCGIGRYLTILPTGSVGIDHNKHSIKQLNKLRLVGFTPSEFKKSTEYKKSSFDSLLLSHVLEHLDKQSGVLLIKEYLPLLKNNGRVVIICPQQKGYKTDSTHVTYLDNTSLRSIVEQVGLSLLQDRSFPFPRLLGKYFRYNEFIVVGQNI